jgi:hypothetical protein
MKRKGGSDGAISGHATAVTYETYKDAIGSGAEYVEFDIRRTRDGVLVVYHDEHAGDSGPLIKDLPYGQLCEALGYAAPKVEDVMRLLGGKAIGHLDLKEVGYEAEAINLALGTFGPGNFVATSLEDASILTIKEDFPQVTAALSLGRDLAEVPRIRRASVRCSELFPLRRIQCPDNEPPEVCSAPPGATGPGSRAGRRPHRRGGLGRNSHSSSGGGERHGSRSGEDPAGHIDGGDLAGWVAAEVPALPFQAAVGNHVVVLLAPD